MKILVDGQTFHTAEINRGIGVYFRNILENMLKNDFVNEFYVSVTNEADLNVLSKWCRQKLNVVINAAHPSVEVYSDDGADASDRYTETLYSDLERHHIDIYWNPNPLMHNVFLPKKKRRVKFTAMIPDLIPLVMKEVYFQQWNRRIVDAYLHKIDVLKKYDMLFCISESTQEDVLRDLGLPATKTQVICLGVSELFVPYPFPLVASEERYILYVGGFDPRKNMFKALEGFARLLEKHEGDEVLHDTKFCIVCSYDESERNVLMECAKKLGIDSRVVLTGFVSDRELLRIYQKAKCLFFPSLYEGFGLPVLESLACGVPVACSDVSSLPEVGGEFAYYFDPNDVEEMADALYGALNAPVDYASRVERYEYAKTFSWENTARKMWGSIERVLRRKAPAQLKSRKKIAWLSPLRPSKSGIANYSDILIRELKHLADIELYYDGEKPPKKAYEEFDLYHISKFARNVGWFDEVFYHIGNNAKFHENIYKLAWDYPGTVVLHDWNIHPFLQHSFFGREDGRYYIDAMVEGYGEEGKKALKESEAVKHLNVFKFPMSDALVKRSKRTIVHNLWVKNKLARNGNIQVVPHFAKVGYCPSEAEIQEYKRQHGINEKDFIVTCLGFINRNKLPFMQIEAIKRLLYDNYPVRMIFGGELSSEISSAVHEKTGGDLEDHFVFTGYQEEDDYYRLLFASDVIVNLRNPSMGEASGTLMQAFATGKSTIVSDSCQYREFPDTVCWKVAHDEFEIEMLVAYLKILMSEKGLRSKVGSNARNYAKKHLNVKNIALRYMDNFL